MRSALFLLIAAAVLPRAARAEESAPSPEPAEEHRASKAETHLKAGVRLYDRGDFDAANVELHRAEMANDSTNEEIVKIQLYLGLVAAQGGDTAAAERSFEAALALDPWARAPASASPKQREQLGDIRRHLYGNKIPPPPRRVTGPGTVKVLVPSATPEAPPKPPPAPTPMPATPATPPAPPANPTPK